MKKLVNDNPQSNMEHMINIVRIGDGSEKEGHWIYLRGMGENGEDIDLCEYIRLQNPEEWGEYSNEEMDEVMCDEISDPLRLIYWLAFSACNLREALRDYENADNWISCAELLPPQAKRVLVKMNYSIHEGRHIICIGCLQRQKWIIESSLKNVKPIKITHWQPLPAAPQEVQL
jgi:hypothetical protein